MLYEEIIVLNINSEMFKVIYNVGLENKEEGTEEYRVRQGCLILLLPEVVALADKFKQSKKYTGPSQVHHSTNGRQQILPCYRDSQIAEDVVVMQ